MMDYMKRAFRELQNEDGLILMAKGLGVKQLLARFIQIYSSSSISTSSDNGSKSLTDISQINQAKPLVFIINAHYEEDLFMDYLLHIGVDIDDLPVIINNETLSKDRETMYKRGGCYFITSRILIVDILSEVISVNDISGFLVNDAHRINETTTECFILRMFRNDRGKKGFVKGFTGDAEAMKSGFGHLERIMGFLGVRKFYIWPRFHVAVDSALQRHQPDVEELKQPMTPNMQRIQNAIVVALDECIRELNSSTTNLDTLELNVENGIFKAFDQMIRRQLDPEWHKLSPKVKQLVSDISTIRRLLEYLLRYDCVTFYSYLVTLQTANKQMRTPSLWLSTAAADDLYKHAKSRVYEVRKSNESMVVKPKDRKKNSQYTLHVKLELNPKWGLLDQILQEVKDDYKKGEGCTPEIGGARVLILVRDQQTAAMLGQHLRFGGKNTLKNRFKDYLFNWKLRQSNNNNFSFGYNNDYRQRNSNFNTSTTDHKYQNQSARFSSAKVENDLLDVEFTRMIEENVSLIGGRKSGDTKNANSRKGNHQNMQDNDDTKRKKKKKRRLERAGQVGVDINEFEENAGNIADEELKMNDDTMFAELDEMDIDVSKFDVKCEPLSDLHIVIHTYDQVSKGLMVLDEFSPSFVILYDPDVGFVRRLEIHQATRTDKIKVFFLVYGESVEEQRYLTSVRREKEAFENLIQDKKTMLLSIDTKDNKGPSLMNETLLDKRNKKKKISSKVVIVDVREFRSTLPSILHEKELKLVPVTLEVGDFVIAPEICIERKSIPDLFGSFASGRLVTQCEAMLKYYKVPTLLIEFSGTKSFSLGSEISERIKEGSIQSMMVLLTINFPLLRILWSRRPHCTGDLFKTLKIGHNDPDLDKAMAAGGGTVDKDDTVMKNLAAEELLLKLPGINVYNYRKVMNECKNLAELAGMNEEELGKLIGLENGKVLYKFLNKTLVYG